MLKAVRARLSIAGSISSNRLRQFGAVFLQTVWDSIIAKFDAPNRQYTLYINGVKTQSAVDTAPAARPLGDEVTYGFTVSDGTAGASFLGFIDTAAFWNNVLITDQDAADLYNSGVPVNPASVVSNPTWSLTFGDDASDDATPTTGQITDQSGNNNPIRP